MFSFTDSRFGAISNDDSQSARGANATAWRRAMQAMGTASEPSANTLMISGGSFYFPSPVFMTRGCIIQGEGGSLNSNSRLHFPYNSSGIIAVKHRGPDDEGDAAGGMIANLDIWHEDSHSIVQRRPGWKYSSGDTVLSQDDDTIMLRLKTDGTTWASLPKTDLKLSVWQPSTLYRVGDTVVSSGFTKASLHYGDSRFTYICMAEGISGEKDPFWKELSDGTFTGPWALDAEISELSQPPKPAPRWRAVTWSAILMLSSVRVDNVATYRWPNAAIHINSESADIDLLKNNEVNNANNFAVTNLKSDSDGMGICVLGKNSNGGFIGYCRAGGMGNCTPGAGGHGFWDNSQSACVWIGNYAESGSGAGWINQSAGNTIWISNHSEMSIPNLSLQGTVTSLGNTAWHQTHMAGNLVHFDFDDGRGFHTTDSTSHTTMRTRRGEQGCIDSFWTTDEEFNFFARRYNPGLSLHLQGWYTDEFVGTNGAIVGGVSGSMAAEGPAHLWTSAGTFVGPAEKKRYFGYDPGIWTDKRLREGQRKVGDIFILWPDTAPGGWRGLLSEKTELRVTPGG